MNYEYRFPCIRARLRQLLLIQNAYQFACLRMHPALQNNDILQICITGLNIHISAVTTLH